MKKRVYFMIESIISFLLSIYSIIIAKETVKATIDSLRVAYANFPQDFQDRVIGIYERAGVKITILFALIVIFASIFLFIFSVNNTLLKHKGLVITFSVFTFFFTDMLIVQLLGIASFIIILCCKRKNPEDFPDRSKKKISKLELPKSSTKDILLSILILIVYFSQFIWSKYLPENFTTILIVEIIFNIIMIILCVLVFYKQLRDNFKTFKENIKAYMRFIMPRLGMAYVFLLIFSIISVLLTKNATSVNQKTVESLPIYYTLPAAVIYAPIVEEILFRGVFRRLIKNNVLFIIISALVFGLLHTMNESSIFNMFVMALPYASLGAYLAYIYVRTNNIFSSITSHAIFNAISSIFTVLL